MFSFVNDEYLSDAKISVFDIGLSRGFGAFDFLRTYAGRPFCLRAHLQRLRHSASRLGLAVPKSDEEIEQIVNRLISLNNLEEANVKFLVTGGVSEDHLMPSARSSFLVMAYPLKSPPATWYEKGISVITFLAERFLPDCKSLNYTTGIVALQKAKEQGAQEAIYTSSRGCVLEGVTSNFFLFSKGTLVTPKGGILSGITRQLVLEIAASQYPVEKREISQEELFSCEEAFITASNKEIVPVVQIDGHAVGSGLPGKQTKCIMQTFRNYTKESSCLNIDWNY